MMQQRALIGSTVILIFLIAGIVGIFIGILGPAWYVVPAQNSSVGIWTNICKPTYTNTSCVDGLEDLLTFDSDLKIIFALMTSSIVFANLGLISAFSICCCSAHRKTWNCCSVINVTLLFLADAFIFSALGYNEYLLQHKDYERGWSLAASWAAGVSLLLSNIASSVILCKVTKNRNDNSFVAGPTTSSRYNYHKREGLKMEDIRPRVAKLTFWK